MQPSDIRLSRQLSFTRATNKGGIFSTPTTIFSISEAAGAPLGELSIRHNKASFSAANPQHDFRLKRNFWGSRWIYEGDAEQTFARISVGFKQAITFADGDRYTMRLKRNWRLFSKRTEHEATHRATFYRKEKVVLQLENTEPLGFFSNVVSAPMKGTITTDITDVRTIMGLLILFQTYLQVQRHAAVAAG